MRTRSKALLAGLLAAFAGPCLPNDYFADLLAGAGSALTGALLSELLNAVFPPA